MPTIPHASRYILVVGAAAVTDASPRVNRITGLRGRREARVNSLPDGAFRSHHVFMVSRVVVASLLLGAAVVTADPTPQPQGVPDPPPKLKQPRSLRDEATRVTSDLVAGEQDVRRDPDLLFTPWAFGRWSANGKAAKLGAGAAVATLVGEATLGLGGSPTVALGAFAAAVTLDSAAADVEAASPEPTKKQKRIKHKLR